MEGSVESRIIGSTVGVGVLALYKGFAHARLIISPRINNIIFFFILTPVFLNFIPFEGQ
jgi:phosphate/sulfate permease